MDIRVRFGQNVRRQRLELGLTQEALAAKVRDSDGGTHWDQAYVSRIESGLVNTTLDSVEQLATALNVAPEALLLYQV